MSQEQTQRVVYDCDTSGYWCSEADNQNAQKRYGAFIDNGAAYEITDRHTPRPWLNYLCNDRFGSVVSNDGLGFTFYKTTLIRITKYDHPVDYLPREFRDGRKVFIKDTATGKEWDLFKDAADLKCVHRPGLTTLTASIDGLEVVMKVFVPLAESAECWVLHLKNSTTQNKRYEVRLEQVWTFSKFGIHTAEEGIPYLSTPGHDLNIQIEKNSISAHSTNADLPFPMFGLFASPQAQKAECLDDVVNRKDGRRFVFKVCRLVTELELAGGQTSELQVVSGAEEKKEDFDKMKSVYSKPASFGLELEKVQQHWKGLLSEPSCKIPDESLQNFLNIWFKNQLYLNFRFVRSGFIGYRDTLQDTWGYTLLEPALARQNLLRTLSHMKKDGSCPRNYSIVDQKHDLRQFMDSGTWIPMAVVDYVKETGEMAILKEPIPYLDDKTPEPLEAHVWKALDLLYQNRGSHGICLVGDGDWNDALEGISRGGKAESAWLTIALFHAQNLMAELYEAEGSREKAKTLRDRSEVLKKVLNEKAWDGNWFIYGYTGKGNPIGSHQNKEGKIHLNSQSWAIFSGLASEDQVKKIRQSVNDHLMTPLGPVLLDPPYVEEGHEVGRIAKLEPGTFENGSIYQHAVAFHILAEVVSGHSEEAFQGLKSLLPTNPANFDSRRTSEPYCTGNYYCGPHHKRFGQNFFSWFTGNASWLLRIGFDHLLGVKAEFDGLRIQPHVPKDWNEFEVKRTFRGTKYHFVFRRAKAGESAGISVDGKKISGNLISPQTTKTAEVQVVY